MTERKKPGPKPKCKECGRKEGEGHYDDCSIGMGVILVGAEAVIQSIPEEKRAEFAAQLEAKADALRSDIAQAYAQRVWDGQSVDVPRAEKLRRVKLALDGQGLSMEGVVL